VGSDSWAGTKSCATGQTVTGIDVSGYQPNTDWAQASASGLDFAIIKASESVGYVNPSFAGDWAATKANGMVRGAYCFFRANADPVQEADFFVQAVNDRGGFELGDFAALDLETTDGETGDVVAANALAWLQRVKDTTGITPIIYTSTRVFDGLLGSPGGFTGFPLWDANWVSGCPTIPSSWPQWAFWQYAGDSLTIPGVTGKNDGDVFNGTKDDLVAFGRSLWGQDPQPPDAGPGPSAPDAGTTAPHPETADDNLRGGCAVGGRSGGAGWILAGLALAGIGLRRRR
jgi:lysozyme